ncbi:MAG: RraA family protein [Cyclobacteriaceae bacterium]
MMSLIKSFLFGLTAFTPLFLISQPHLLPKERVIFLTEEWKGDRDDYGRPLVPDAWLDRVSHVSVEEAWKTLKENGYNNQLETEWHILDPERVMVGRAFTTTFLPKRPGLDDRMIELGNEAGFQGGTNQWPMSMLTQGDVIVADHYGKLREGAFLGDNLAQAIYTNSGTGAIINGHGRDIIGVKNIDGINIWAKGWHPSHSAERMLISINDITRMGEAVCLPGDVVLATQAGVIFIPPHLMEKVLLGSEVVRLEDAFRQDKIAKGIYTSQQVYQSEWTSEINQEFYRWLSENRTSIQDKHHVPLEIIEEMLKNKSRDWKSWIK